MARSRKASARRADRLQGDARQLFQASQARRLLRPLPARAQAREAVAVWDCHHAGGGHRVAAHQAG